MEVREQAADEQEGAERLGEIVGGGVEQTGVERDEEAFPAPASREAAEEPGADAGEEHGEQPDAGERGRRRTRLSCAEEPAEPAVERVAVAVRPHCRSPDARLPTAIGSTAMPQ